MQNMSFKCKFDCVFFFSEIQSELHVSVFILVKGSEDFRYKVGFVNVVVLYMYTEMKL